MMILNKIKSSVFFSHLVETFSMFVFVLLLQMLLSIHLSDGISLFASFGVMTSLPFFVKCTIRSILWCSLSWFLVALVRKGYVRQILTIILVAFLCIPTFSGKLSIIATKEYLILFQLFLFLLQLPQVNLQSILLL